MSTEQARTIAIPLMIEGHSGHPPAAPFPGSPKSKIILPKWVYIKDRHGRYLTVRSGPEYSTLTFRSGEDPDLDCAFEAILAYDSSYRFLARNGNYIVRYYTSWYAADAGSMPAFDIISARGNKVYLKDDYTSPRFMSDELKDTGSPVAHGYINESSLMEINQAAIKNEIVDIKYDIPGAKVSEAAPIIALNAMVRNDSDGDAAQNLQYTYEKWTVGTWNNSAGVEIGTKATFEAGVPLVASAEFEVSVSASYSHEWGGEEGVKHVITSSTTVHVPPKKKARATIIIKNAHIDVGFTYTQRILWSDGQVEDHQKSGIYKNVDSWNVDVVLDNWQDI